MANRESRPKAALNTLPPEILVQIVKHIETARALSQLSLTCRKFHTVIENDGFRIFAQTHFSYVEFPAVYGRSFWRDATHGVTTLSRNWDRKAFIARRINPGHDANEDGRRRRGRIQNSRQVQTMGFVPNIDSYEAWYADRWTSRKEVVGWAAGADLIVRVKTMGSKAKDDWEASEHSNTSKFDVHRHEYQWMKYHSKGVLEGRDDVTSVNLLPQQGLDDPELVIVGRASGGLACVSLSKDSSQGQVKSTYATKGRPVRSATTSVDKKTLLAACLSDSAVVLYRLSPQVSDNSPVAEISAPSGRTWSSRFLSNDRLAVGYGAAKEPVIVYNIGRGELTRENMLTMGFNDPGAHARLDTNVANDSSATSAYSVAPIPTAALAGGAEGNVFLSGAYDGSVRLHDVRSPEATVAIFRDPVDTFSPVYSLLPIGSERFVAGGGRHSIIKIFDLRLPGGQLYHAADLDPCSSARHNLPKRNNSKQQLGCCGYHYEAKHSRRGWNVFLDMGSRRQRNRGSPVYSLSRPSQCSPSLFAGIESTVIQVDMVSIMDKHQDPVFEHSSAAKANMSYPKHYIHDFMEQRWNPQGDVGSLPMYEHDEGPVHLLKQRDVRVRVNVEGMIEGWDERWSYHRSYR